MGTADLLVLAERKQRQIPGHGLIAHPSSAFWLTSGQAHEAALHPSADEPRDKRKATLLL